MKASSEEQVVRLERRQGPDPEGSVFVFVSQTGWLKTTKMYSLRVAEASTPKSVPRS